MLRLIAFLAVVAVGCATKSPVAGVQVEKYWNITTCPTFESCTTVVWPDCNDIDRFKRGEINLTLRKSDGTIFSFSIETVVKMEAFYREVKAL